MSVVRPPIPKGHVIETIEQFEQCRLDRRVVTVRRHFKGRPTSMTFVANMAYASVRRLVSGKYITLHDDAPEEEFPF